MTGTLIHPTAVKDILTGIFFSVLIILSMLTLPVVSIFAWLILPLPVLFYRLKIGRNGSVIIMTASLAILMALTGDFVIYGFYYGSFLFTGLILGECIERHLHIEKIILFTCASLVILFFVFLVILMSNQALNADQLINGYVKWFQTLSTQVYTEMSRLYSDVAIDKTAYDQISNLFMLTFPGLILVTYINMALVNVLLIKVLLNRNNITVKSIENLNQWRVSPKMVPVLILNCLMLWIPLSPIKIFFLNCMMVTLLIYYYQGIGVVSYTFKRFGVPVFIKGFAYFLFLTQPLFIILVISGGVFDTWFNFRKLDTTIDNK